MPETTRGSFWSEVLRRPVTFLVLAPLGLLGLTYLFVLIRDEFVRPIDHERWRISTLLLHYLPWYWWVLLTLVIVIGVVGENSYLALRRRETATNAVSTRVRALEGRLRPQFRVLDDHPSKYMLIAAGENQNPCEWHRIVFENIGLEPVNNCKVTLHAVDGVQLPILPLELHQMNKPAESNALCTCQQHVEVAFDLFSYSYDDKAAIWGNLSFPFLIKRPHALLVSISGDGASTLRRTIIVSGKNGERLITSVQEPDETDMCV